MQRQLITAGEFARLACTTKRTVQYYDKIGILKPHKISNKGYRYYRQGQILDFQVILLLRALRIPLSEIRTFLKKNLTLKDLFREKKSSVRDEIKYLQYTLKSLSKFFRNLDKNGTLIKPKIKKVKPFKIFYIDKVGSYSGIAAYCSELIGMFKKIPGIPVALTIFEEEEYRPKKSRMKIGLLYKRGMVIKKEYENMVKKGSVDRFKAITWMHHGSGATLSLFWQEVYKYMRKNNIQQDFSKPELEIYWKVSGKPFEQFFEIYVPIK